MRRNRGKKKRGGKREGREHSLLLGVSMLTTSPETCGSNKREGEGEGGKKKKGGGKERARSYRRLEGKEKEKKKREGRKAEGHLSSVLLLRSRSVRRTEKREGRKEKGRGESEGSSIPYFFSSLLPAKEEKDRAGNGGPQFFGSRAQKGGGEKKGGKGKREDKGRKRLRPFASGPNPVPEKKKGGRKKGKSASASAPKRKEGGEKKKKREKRPDSLSLSPSSRVGRP